MSKNIVQIRDEYKNLKLKYFKQWYLNLDSEERENFSKVLSVMRKEFFSNK